MQEITQQLESPSLHPYYMIPYFRNKKHKQRNTLKLPQSGSHPRIIWGSFFLEEKGEEAPPHKELGLSDLYAGAPFDYSLWVPSFMHQSEPFLPQDLHPCEGNSVKHRLRISSQKQFVLAQREQIGTSENKRWSWQNHFAVGCCRFALLSRKEKAHKHKLFCPVTDWVRGGLPTWWPGVKCSCAVCGTQGKQTFSSGYLAGRIGDRGDRELLICQMS